MSPHHSAIGAHFKRLPDKIDIPPRPVILDDIHAEIRKDNPDLDHLSSIISSDAALAANLISLTNSSYFGFYGCVHTAREALMVLGLNVTRKAITCIIIRHVFGCSPHIKTFWDTSVRIAELSGWLAQRIRHSALRADDAYTLGLFRNSGIPILLSQFPGYLDILNAANNDAINNFTEIEDAHLPTNHAVIGCSLAQNWWLSDEIILSIRHHHDLDILKRSSIPPSLDSRCMIAIVQLAEYLLQQHFECSITQEWRKLGPTCLQLLNLNEAGLKRVMVESAMLINTTDGDRAAHI